MLRTNYTIFISNISYEKSSCKKQIARNVNQMIWPKVFIDCDSTKQNSHNINDHKQIGQYFVHRSGNGNVDPNGVWQFFFFIRLFECPLEICIMNRFLLASARCRVFVARHT